MITLRIIIIMDIEIIIIVRMVVFLCVLFTQYHIRECITLCTTCNT